MKTKLELLTNQLIHVKKIANLNEQQTSQLKQQILKLQNMQQPLNKELKATKNNNNVEQHMKEIQKLIMDAEREKEL